MKMIEDGRANVETTLRSIVEEFDIRKDYIVKPQALDYDVDEETGTVHPIIVREANERALRFDLTSHSESQLYGILQMPKHYADKLLDLKEYGLLYHNLSTMSEKMLGEGVLLRTVNNTAKGILSPSFRRMDASPIYEAFVGKAMENGFLPHRGMTTTYRNHIGFLYPQIFQPIEGELVLYTLGLTTGDYGSQAMSIEMGIMRIICSNLMIGYDMLRKVHIGKRFESDEDFVKLSKTTIEYDMKALASGIGDISEQAEKHMEVLNGKIEEAGKSEIDLKGFLDGMKKKGFRKEITEGVKFLYEQTSDWEIMPQKKSAWRLMNAISFLSRSDKIDADTALDLQREAFSPIAKAV